MPKFKLTTSSVKQRCRPPADGETKPNGKPIDEHWYWDTEDRGFFLKISRTCSTFFVQRDVRGRTRRVKIGRHPTWTVDQARKRARELIVQMDQGIDPNAQKREEAARGTTLREAREWHISSMRARRCAERSLETVCYETDRHLSDWLDRPLADIRPNECARRHERITRDSGPYAANRALQTFRACWNTAKRRLDDLGECPTRGVTFNRTRRRREPIPWTKLPDWRRAVDGIQNPIRRDLQLFILFTGLRSTDAKTVRWEHVDFEAGTIHRPKPKGGEDRAFTVPVSRFVLDLLEARRAENAIIYPRDDGWVFPSRNMKGGITHVQQTKEARYVGGRKLNVFPTAHRLRDTFATAGDEAGVDFKKLKVLMNHTLPESGDVTWGYIRPDVEHLRKETEKVAAFLLERMAHQE